MPGGDRTGPLGLGPMTGRAAGYCAGYPMPGFANPIPGRGWGWSGWGRGWGRGRGWYGRGREWRWFGPGWGYPYYGAPLAYPYYGDPYGYPYAPEMSPEQEGEMLKEQAKALQEEMKTINDRIAELEASAKAKQKKG